ncbi:ester cyclase [Candidatus Halobonum tyrrellensis]|uniref:SnoaL-like domain-containing protein n=1 Tax=Candidatus Halobonum tyrrellensis G22 TaxID=1324957 RepID=V4HAI1_9EURY|nr:ester cyclase [Candidatus Halobonum tyrrellensis]ESP87715.1 hypothetical protein K933_12880 [Candidatus Halobonum tyrrellensis G22]
MNEPDQPSQREQWSRELAARSRRVVTDVVDGGDPDAMRELVADGVVVHGFGDATTRGIDAFADALAAWHEAVPDGEDAVDDVVVQDDTVVLFCTRRGTLEADRPDIPADAGDSFEVDVVHRLRFSDWQVAEWWWMADALGAARQLDALPEAADDAARLAVGARDRPSN